MDDEAADNFLIRIAKGPANTPIKGPLDFAVQEIAFEPERDDTDGEPVTDDKIGGFPAWIQEEAHSHCPECRNNKSMEYRLQISPPEVEGLPFSEGSAIFISQCKIHLQKFGMIWQCS